MFREIRDKIKMGVSAMQAVYFLIFSVLGIIVLVFSFHSRKEEKTLFENGIQVFATITKIEAEETKSADGTTKKLYKVYADYEVNGISYDDIYLCNYKSGMSEGDKIEAYCKPEDPTDILVYYDVDAHYNDIALIALFMIVVGALPMVMFVLRVRKNR